MLCLKKNYGCTRKTYNIILDKCKDKHGDNLKNITGKDVNQFLNEAKDEFPYLRDTESTSFNRHEMMFIKLLKIIFTVKNTMLQNSTLKRKQDLASDKPYDQIKDL